MNSESEQKRMESLVNEVAQAVNAAIAPYVKNLSKWIRDYENGESNHEQYMRSVTDVVGIVLGVRYAQANFNLVEESVRAAWPDAVPFIEMALRDMEQAAKKRAQRINSMAEDEWKRINQSRKGKMN